MNEVLRDLTTVLLAIIGLAVFAVIVSRRSNTSGVINSGSSAFNTALATATGPVTGYDVGPPIYADQGGGLFGGLFQPSSVGEFGAGFRTAGGMG